jgi:serine/threonine-protein kinase RsbW
MADLLKFSVPGKPEYVGVVRLAVSSAANTAGFDIEDIEDIKVAVSEVCTHIFCDNDSVVTYEVSCELGDGGMVISIDDMEEKEKHEDIRALDDWPCFYGNEMGIGSLARPFVNDFFDMSTSILMLRALMDEVDIFSSRNENMLIRMIKHL